MRAAFPLRSRARPVASFSCGSAGRALGWGPRAWEARAGFQHVVNAAARAGRGEPGSHSHCGLQTPAPGPRGGRDRPGLVPSRAGPPRTGD